MSPFDVGRVASECAEIFPRSKWTDRDFEIFSRRLAPLKLDVGQCIAVLEWVRSQSKFPTPNMREVMDRMYDVQRQGEPVKQGGCSPVQARDEAQHRREVVACDAETSAWFAGLGVEQVASLTAGIKQHYGLRATGKSPSGRGYLRAYARAIGAHQ